MTKQELIVWLKQKYIRLHHQKDEYGHMNIFNQGECYLIEEILNKLGVSIGT